jgi:predicted RNA-binding protein with PIN domain
MSAIKPAVLLVDGYNIIGLSPKLQVVREHGSLGEARRELTEILANYSAFHGHETELVFDSQYHKAKGEQEQVTHNLTVSYTKFGQTADSYIERACALFFREDIRRFQKRLIVATSDRAQWLTAVGYGAEWMSAQKLAQQAGLCQEQVRHHKPKAKQSGKRLAASLDAKARHKLAQLRQDLFRKGQ